MGCTDPLRRGVGAPHQCPLESVASYLICADVRLHNPMTHRIPSGTQCLAPSGIRRRTLLNGRTEKESRTLPVQSK